MSECDVPAESIEQFDAEAVVCVRGDNVFVDPGLIPRLKVVLDTANGRSFLLILDAGTFAEIGRAVVNSTQKSAHHHGQFSSIPSGSS